MTAEELLTGIESGDLTARMSSVAVTVSMGFYVRDNRLARMICSPRKRPTAKVSSDDHSVEVHPSIGTKGEFSIPCQNHEDAVLIAEALDGCLDSAFREFSESEK